MRVFHKDVGLRAVSSLFILGADVSWLMHDILANGLNLWYIILIGLFAIGWIGLSYSLYIHHNHINKRVCIYYTDDDSHSGD